MEISYIVVADAHRTRCQRSIASYFLSQEASFLYSQSAFMPFHAPKIILRAYTLVTEYFRHFRTAFVQTYRYSFLRDAATTEIK